MHQGKQSIHLRMMIREANRNKLTRKGRELRRPQNLRALAENILI